MRHIQPVMLARIMRVHTYTRVHARIARAPAGACGFHELTRTLVLSGRFLYNQHVVDEDISASRLLPWCKKGELF